MSANPVRVLIIDDHESFRSVARELLERRGFAVVAEADGAAAGLAAAERVAPEAVVLDLRLRDGSGFDVCRKLTRDDPRRAVLLVSADEPDRGRVHIESCGARGFVLKSRLAAADLRALLGAA
jgi:DNA-binding NarL/FixJ family response regulator